MKKKLPLSLLRSLNPEIGDDVKVVKPESAEDDFIILFQDSDSESEFFFRLDKYNEQRNEYVISFMPLNQDQVSSKTMSATVSQVKAHFDNWYELIKAYNKAETFLDDEVLKGHYENLIDGFEMEDSKWSKPPTLKELEKIDAHLIFICEQIENIDSDNDNDLIIEVKNESESLRKELTSDTRKNIVKKLFRIYAKVVKLGLPYVRTVINKAVEQGVIEGFKYLLG